CKENKKILKNPEISCIEQVFGSEKLNPNDMFLKKGVLYTSTQQHSCNHHTPITSVKNVQWYHLYISRGLIKPIKSVFINKSNTKFSCPISLIKNVTKTNIKILIRDIYP